MHNLFEMNRRRALGALLGTALLPHQSIAVPYGREDARLAGVITGAIRRSIHAMN